MKKISECVEESGCKKSFSRKEKGKKITFVSERPFDCEIVRIDNCVFSDHTIRRCDYLFLMSHKIREAYYVELKGDNNRSACEQLFHTIDRTKSQITGFKISAKVIGTKGFHPKVTNNEFYRNVKRLIKRKIEFHKVHKGNNYTHTEHI
jgi:hypothetical protein